MQGKNSCHYLIPNPHKMNSSYDDEEIYILHVMFIRDFTINILGEKL